MPFYKFGCSYVMLDNIQNTWCAFCLFCEYWFEIITITCIVYTCSTNALHVNKRWLPSSFCSGLPTELPTLSILESSGLPFELLTELPTISVYGSSRQPFLYGKIPNGSSFCSPLRCPLSPYTEVLDSLICMTKFSWAAHGQPTPLPTGLPTFSFFGSSGLHTELPTVSIYGSSGQPNLLGKIPMGSLRAAHSVAHVQPMGSEVGSSPNFFRMSNGQFYIFKLFFSSHDNQCSCPVTNLLYISLQSCCILLKIWKNRRFWPNQCFLFLS